MTKATLKEKVLIMEAELETVKKALAKEPDFDVDERIWKSVRPMMKRTGKKLYAKEYGKV